MNLREEAFDYPSVLVATRPAVFLGLVPLIPLVATERRDQLRTLVARRPSERIAVIRLVSDQAFRLYVNYVEVESRSHERDVVIDSRVRGLSQPQTVTVTVTVTIDQRHYLQCLFTSRGLDLIINVFR